MLSRLVPTSAAVVPRVVGVVSVSTVVWSHTTVRCASTAGVASPDVASWDTNWDKLEGDDGYGHAKARFRTLVLVRHGQYVSAPTDAGRVLTPLGRDQAEAAGKRLRELLAAKGVPDNRITFHVSTMARAQQTGDLMLKAFPVDTRRVDDALLPEGAPCEHSPQHPSYFPSPYTLWRDGGRIEAAFRRHFHRPRNDDDESPPVDVLVCHGNVIRYCMLRALQLPPSAWLRFSPAHASFTVITISNSGNVSVSAFSDSGHLLPQSVTTS